MRPILLKLSAFGPYAGEMILELDKLGYMTSKADNNAHEIRGTSKGLMVGIEMLQSGLTDGRLFFVDDEQYGMEPILKEIGLYCMDQHGNPVDAYNHAMDSLRYGYNKFRKGYLNGA